MIYYQYIKYQQDELINKRKVTIFKRLKKGSAVKKPNQEKGLQDVDNKNQNGPKNDIVLLSGPRKQDIYKPMIISSFRGEDKKIGQSPAIQIEQKVSIFETVYWDQVEVGDIIYLQRNEICPADILILESNLEYCSADVTSFSGNTNQILKSPNILTSMSRVHQFKNNCFEYRLLLSGKVNYDRY